MKRIFRNDSLSGSDRVTEAVVSLVFALLHIQTADFFLAWTFVETVFQKMCLRSSEKLILHLQEG